MPGSSIPCQEMYKAFVQYCKTTGRSVIGQDAFEFVFARMEHPAPVLDRGTWIGYPLRMARRPAIPQGTLPMTHVRITAASGSLSWAPSISG